MEAYLERIKSNAEELFKIEFPKKALQLDDIVNSQMLRTENMLKVSASNHFPTPEDFLANAVIPKSKANDENKMKTDQSDEHIVSIYHFKSHFIVNR
jgi:hypothetical protein